MKLSLKNPSTMKSPGQPNFYFSAYPLKVLNQQEPEKKSYLHIYTKSNGKKKYAEGLKKLEVDGHIRLPYIPQYASNNAHMFYIVCKDRKERTEIIELLHDHDVNAVFHYLSLHKSPFYKDKHDGRELPYSDAYSDTLLRLPFYYELRDENIVKIVDLIWGYYC